jgi:hypothetical protein
VVANGIATEFVLVVRVKAANRLGTAAAARPIIDSSHILQGRVMGLSL